MKVFVSGCFDLLHAGHVAFLESAAAFGPLSVSVAADRTVVQLKRRSPVLSQDERLYLVKSLRCVSDAFVASGIGMLDFADDLRARRPDLFIVNRDGHTAAKQALCESLDVEYRVLERTPPPGLPARSTTELRPEVLLPYRIDLAGAWLDQPFISRLHPGAVIVVSLEPDVPFDERSGMAVSTRATAERLWGSRLPVDAGVEHARLLFGAENPPGKSPVAGSQDALGLVLPGIHRLNYAGEYWPCSIERLPDEGRFQWLEGLLHFIQLGARHDQFDVFAGSQFTVKGAKRLSQSVDDCWQALVDKDDARLGRAVLESFKAQRELLPAMSNESVEAAIHALPPDVLGYKLAGAGGGGYLVAVSRAPIPGSVQVRVRREERL